MAGKRDLVAGEGIEEIGRKTGYEENGEAEDNGSAGGGYVWRCGGGEVGMTGRIQRSRHIQGGILVGERCQ